MAYRCGLVTNTWESLPLKDVKISCLITNLTAKVETLFTYTNTLNYVTEAKFVFPLEDVALYSFEAKIEDRVIVAECRPRKEAKTTYDEAVSRGHTAFIMEQDEQCEDIFQMSLGHVPVNGTVIITMKYAGHLSVDLTEENGIKTSCAVLTLPSVINPRYSPNENRGIRHYDFFDGTLWNDISYTIAFAATILMSEPISSVTSVRDQYIVTKDPQDSRRAKVVLQSGFKPDHDLQMVIVLAKPLQSSAIIESSDVNQFPPNLRHCIMVQCMPDLTEVACEQELRTELVFVIDRSGSMSGFNIQRASESLLLLLKSLPSGCRFQIIGFGDRHAALFPEVVDYNEETLARALEYQEALKADFGGTEVLPALQTAYNSPLSGEGWFRQIIFITDGDVSNADEVVGLVRSNVHKARLFSIGIGEGIGTYLVSSVARAGRGLATFVRDGSQLRTAVMKVLKSALEPRSLPTSLRWNLKMKNAKSGDSVPKILAVPTLPPAIFSGCFTTMFAFFDGEPEELTGEVELNFDVMGDACAIRVPISVPTTTQLLTDDKEAPVHRLAAKYLLNQLSDELKSAQMTGDENVQASVRKQIEQISCVFNVLCPFTSFVGVDPVTHHEALVAKPQTQDESGPMYDMVDACCYDQVDSLSIELASCVQDMAFDCAAAMHSAVMSAPSPAACRLKSFSMEMSEPMKPELDAITKLAKLQKFAGFWSMADDVLTVLELDKDAFSKGKPTSWPSASKHDLSEDVWVTALVVSYFEILHADSKIEWEFVARKARQWLESQAKLVESSAVDAKVLCEKLIEQANQAIRVNLKK